MNDKGKRRSSTSRCERYEGRKKGGNEVRGQLQQKGNPNGKELRRRGRGRKYGEE
jgi:hypothetical protein